MSRFEALAHGTVVSSGGQVVKMIGEEVMFVLNDPGDGAQVARRVREQHLRSLLPCPVRQRFEARLRGGDGG